MKMIPPDAQAAIDPTLAMNDSPISELLGESLRITTSTKQETGDSPGAAAITAPNNTADTVDPAFTTTTDETPVAATPGAIPIYDAARDAGTLVVSNLPPAPAGQEYNLWVQTTSDGAPVRLGILPDAGTSPSESFDFNLGSNQVRPAGFTLTLDPKDKPAAPHSKNTVLQSPQTAKP
jgi:Anti-sigma-K factor rskA